MLTSRCVRRWLSRPIRARQTFPQYDTIWHSMARHIHQLNASCCLISVAEYRNLTHSHAMRHGLWLSWVTGRFFCWSASVEHVFISVAFGGQTLYAYVSFDSGCTAQRLFFSATYKFSYLVIYTLVIISVPADTASSSLLYLQSSCANRMLFNNDICFRDRTVLCLYWCSFCMSILYAYIFIVCFAFDKV